MVDNIKDRSSLVTKNPSQSSPRAVSLRKNFQDLSSGLKVQDALKDQPAVVQIAQNDKADRVAKLLSGLNDAVSFSSKALHSLEQVAKQDVEQSDELAVVENIARGLESLQSEIGNVVKGLRQRADTADVMQANLSAADARMEDVETAKSQAESTGSHIEFNGPEAMDAHNGNGGLTLDKVASLLAD